MNIATYTKDVTFWEEWLQCIKDSLKMPNFMSNTVSTHLWNGGRAFIRIITARDGFFVTPILIDIHISVLGIMWLYGIDIIHPEPQDIIQFGGNAPSLIKEGQYWRLISGLFIHDNINVFLATVFNLFVMGIWFEKSIGKIKYTIVYITIAVIAGVAGVYF